MNIYDWKEFQECLEFAVALDFNSRLGFAVALEHETGFESVQDEAGYPS